MLREGVYPYEYMDEREKFNETALPGKDNFYSNLDIKDIKIQIRNMKKYFVNILK